MHEKDFESFDNDTDTSDENYSAFVAWLSARTTEDFREAHGDAARQKSALLRYYHTGLRANLTPAELIGFLAITSRSILDEAGYTDAESDAVMALSDGLTDREFYQE